MSKELDKYHQNEIIKSTIEKELGTDGLAVGDIFINPSSSTIAVKITSITFKDNKYQNQDPAYKVIIGYKETANYELTDWEEEKHEDFYNFNYFHVKNSIRVKCGEDISQYLDKAKKVMSGELSIETLNDDNTDNSLNSETSIISKDSKTNLTTIQNSLEEKKKNAELIQAFVSIEMEKKKRELEQVRQKLNGVIEVFKKKISKIMRVITTIELYLGIDEELFQIQEGELAPKETPISFRQAVLYMDEEIGHWKNGGLDFTNIDWFDQWLVKDENFKKLLPEEKGLVVFRPRRYDKDYGSDPHYNASMNQENKYRTYLLIRNGECLYRVYTENIVILPRLFPKRDELQKLMEEIQKENLRSWDEEKKKDNIDDLVHQYKKRAILLQGLVDRTDVFHPLPVDKINIFDMSNLEGKVNFIYDDEATLPSGRLSFWDWHKEINSKIGKGSRVLITGFDGKNDEVKDRIYYYTTNYVSPPSVGIYEVEEYLHKGTKSMKRSDFENLKVEWDKRGIKYEITNVREKVYHINYQESSFPHKEKPGYVPIYEDEVTVRSTYIHLTILYNPGDTVYGPWGTYDPHDRKKRIRLRIYPTDDFVLNYDQISLEDINFYLTSRVDRPNYLKMLPLLDDVKNWRIEELENEKNFAKMVYAQVYQKLKKQTEEYIYQKILEAIDWWKFKNMWKRPIDKDDTKALRMITNRILNKKN
jgi:hypothetical protein